MRLILCIGFMLLTLSLVALNVDVSGQYENSLYPQMFDTSMKMTDLNKLRLDLSGSIDDNIDFQANYNIELYDGKRTILASECIPEDVLLEYADSMNVPVEDLDQIFYYKYDNRYYLDNANITIYWKQFDLRVGRQLIPWGTGYSRNPTDCFHQKNILDPTYDKEGINAFKLDYNLDLNTTVTAIMNSAEDWEASKRAIKIRSKVLDYDFSLSYVRMAQASHESINQYGSDVSGQLFGLGVWAEAAYRTGNEIDDYLQLLAGSDYTFENGLYFMAEYYRNNNGQTDRDDYTFDDWANYLEGTSESLGRDYGFAMIQYPLTELMNGSFYASYNLNDGSAILYPWVDFTLGDNIETDIVLYIPIGSKNSEYGVSDVGGLLRIRAFF